MARLAVGLSSFGGLVAGQLVSGRRRDRFGVVEVRLSPADHPTRITIRHASGAWSQHPVRELSRVAVVRDEIVNPYIVLELKLGARVVRTQAGYDIMPTEFINALTAAGVDVRIIDTADY